MESWKTIEKDKRYHISSEGRVKSFAKGPERILRQSYHKDYLVVSIGGKYSTVHRLVAEAFIPNPKNLPLVDHKNGNRKDNSVDNLRWVTHSQNTKNVNTKRGIKYPTFKENEISNEVWVDVPYSIFNINELKISNLGRLKKPYSSKNRYGTSGNEKIYSFGASEKNYCEVKRGKKRRALHRLVWECFNGKIPKGLQVGHIDNDKVNNRLSNLELVTGSENIKHNHETGNFNQPDYFNSERVNKVINLFYVERKTTTEIIDSERIGGNQLLPILKGDTLYEEKYKKYYDKYEIYARISYLKGRIKTSKKSKYYDLYDDVISLKNNGYSFRKGAKKLGISLDAYRQTLRTRDKIKGLENKIKELEKII